MKNYIIRGLWGAFLLLLIAGYKAWNKALMFYNNQRLMTSSLYEAKFSSGELCCT